MCHLPSFWTHIPCGVTEEQAWGVLHPKDIGQLSFHHSSRESGGKTFPLLVQKILSVKTNKSHFPMYPQAWASLLFLSFAGQYGFGQGTKDLSVRNRSIHGTVSPGAKHNIRDASLRVRHLEVKYWDNQLFRHVNPSLALVINLSSLTLHRWVVNWSVFDFSCLLWDILAWLSEVVYCPCTRKCILISV